MQYEKACLHLDLVSNAENICHIADPVMTNLADVQQAAGAVLKLQEGSIQLDRLYCADRNISNLKNKQTDLICIFVAN